LHLRDNGGMILPEIKRVVRFEAMAGKTIRSVEERMDMIRILFTDGMFADLEPDTSSKIKLQRGKPTRYEQRRGAQG
jgi:hypothetical protein